MPDLTIRPAQPADDAADHRAWAETVVCSR